jgi:hypothetical protein
MRRQDIIQHHSVLSLSAGQHTKEKINLVITLGILWTCRGLVTDCWRSVPRSVIQLMYGLLTWFLLHWKTQWASFWLDVLCWQLFLPCCANAILCQKAWQCFFPQYLLPHIKTPLFIVNGGYDWWQVNPLMSLLSHGLATPPSRSDLICFPSWHLMQHAVSTLTAWLFVLATACCVTQDTNF